VQLDARAGRRAAHRFHDRDGDGGVAAVERDRVRYGDAGARRPLGMVAAFLGVGWKALVSGGLLGAGGLFGRGARGAGLVGGGGVVGGALLGTGRLRRLRTHPGDDASQGGPQSRRHRQPPR